ncbi:DMT family transporter [Leucothrix arctica]|uniref:DMT family transporter n=1 Tax=Leucothrix arctica TaxID=1481894 RepID=UPI001BA72543|nr:DMT family transporter [Leucothrix arctica]
MSAHNIPIFKTISLTALALIAFAANSILCRLALGNESIDAAGFTIIRLLAGALTLIGILQLRTYLDARDKRSFGQLSSKEDSIPQSKGSWFSGLMLFIYAALFSFAYVSMDTGTGALILFGAVQLTMILMSIFKGERLLAIEWMGMIAAFAGFVYLVLPQLGTPSLIGFLMMSVSGIAWGFYTLAGRGSKNPLSDTSYNFLRTLPLVSVLFIVSIQQLTLTAEGVLWAFLSGSLASGVGYSIWYSALRGLSSTQAAVVQLLVPMIAALGGVMFMSEVITTRVMISGGMILGGIALVVLGRYYLTAKA